MIHRTRTLRTLPCALACAAALALGAPAAASPGPAGPATLWQWLSGLVGLQFLAGEEGAIYDPNGATASGTDPNEAGGIFDPNGATASAADPNEAGHIFDPNG